MSIICFIALLFVNGKVRKYSFCLILLCENTHQTI